MPGFIDVLIMAAGHGQRFGQKKQFLKFGNTTVLGAAVKLFDNIKVRKSHKEINRVIVVFPPDMNEYDVRKKGMLSEDIGLTMGELKRKDSVSNGLELVKEDYVLIHDAARPDCSAGTIKRVIEAMFKYGAVAPAIRPSSTVKYLENGRLKPLSREKVLIIQTPQGYRTSEIKRAYQAAGTEEYTDSSSIAQAAGINVRVVDGDNWNIKITLPEDYEYLRGRSI